MAVQADKNNTRLAKHLSGSVLTVPYQGRNTSQRYLKPKSQDDQRPPCVPVMSSSLRVRGCARGTTLGFRLFLRWLVVNSKLVFVISAQQVTSRQGRLLSSCNLREKVLAA